MIDEEIVRKFPYYATLEIIKLDRSTGISHVLDGQVIRDMIYWCTNCVGRDNFYFGWAYPPRDSRKYYVIRFKNGNDAAAFRLVWGGYISHDLA